MGLRLVSLTASYERRWQLPPESAKANPTQIPQKSPTVTKAVPRLPVHCMLHTSQYRKTTKSRKLREKQGHLADAINRSLAQKRRLSQSGGRNSITLRTCPVAKIETAPYDRLPTVNSQPVRTDEQKSRDCPQLDDANENS